MTFTPIFMGVRDFCVNIAMETKPKEPSVA
jgi:hypothetical protein